MACRNQAILIVSDLPVSITHPVSNSFRFEIVWLRCPGCTTVYSICMENCIDISFFANVAVSRLFHTSAVLCINYIFYYLFCRWLFSAFLPCFRVFLWSHTNIISVHLFQPFDVLHISIQSPLSIHSSRVGGPIPLFSLYDRFFKFGFMFVATLWICSSFLLFPFPWWPYQLCIFQFRTNCGYNQLLLSKITHTFYKFVCISICDNLSVKVTLRVLAILFIPNS